MAENIARIDSWRIAARYFVARLSASAVSAFAINWAIALASPPESRLTSPRPARIVPGHPRAGVSQIASSAYHLLTRQQRG